MKRCALCKRRYLKGNLRSHSNRATIKRQQLNLQNTILKGKKILACVKCIKSLTKKGVIN